ncbi:propanediol utilization protein [Pseudomonas aeruginosa]|uniref:propanediol utilization protein n=1 Tax=Pseudomonas aeruginosa TaxID=287 RepID=UPI0034585C71
MAKSITLIIETSGNVVKSGISQKNNTEYHMCEAFAHIPGIPYPQLFEYFASKQNEILPSGMYECDVKVSIKDKRLSFEVDPRQARRVASPAAAKAPVQAAS